MIYKANKTMRMLGEQRYSIEALVDENTRQELQEIKAAYISKKLTQKHELYKLVYDKCVQLLTSVYDLGVIHGIRRERQRKKEKALRRANGNRASL
ncbi:MAG: hypothetical protein IJV18_11220 [Acidaminococcaceae bacterium]|nr:hypothetical protein [Acidaminococcaceae bacterium]